MFLADISFYLFSAVLLASALVVVSTKNTIYSVMFLILAFFNAAGLFVLLGAEFLAMLLVIVYVGAIAVLFLFVVMMLNIDDKPEKSGFNKYLPITILIAGTLFVEMFIITQGSTILFGSSAIKSLPTPKNISNTKAIGDVLYTTFAYPFQLAGMVLFVAMIGAIVLTLRDQDRFIKKQNIGEQVGREKADSVKLVKVAAGEGIDI